MSQLIWGYFKVTKKIYGGGLPVYVKCRPLWLHGCVTKRNCHLKSSAMVRNTFNIRHS